jgi:hypothetical protein
MGWKHSSARILSKHKTVGWKIGRESFETKEQRRLLNFNKSKGWV